MTSPNHLRSALSGTNYGCYDQCPASNVEKCGPDPKLGIQVDMIRTCIECVFQDIRYCYCKDYNDKDCQPYLGND